jgi:hypothetical protein
MRKYGYKLAFLLLLVVAVFWYAWQGAQHQLVVLNQSGQVVTSMKITLEDETITFANLFAGEEAVREFKTRTGGTIVLKGELADGTRVAGRFTYQPQEMFGERVRFVVKHKGSIEFEQK